MRRDGDGAVPVAEPRQHLTALLKAGRTLEELATITGLPYAVLRVVRQHKPTGVDEVVAQRILAVPYGHIPGTPETPAIGAQRRLQALLAMGHTVDSVAAQLNAPAELVASLVDHLPPTRMIPTRLWHAIDRVYDRFAMVPGDDAELRERSRAVGFVTALAWDDEEIDNPNARSHRKASAATGIDEIAIERRLHFDRSVSLTSEDAEVLLDIADERGVSLQDLAEMLGSTVEAAERRLSRHRNRRRESTSSTDPAGAAVTHQVAEAVEQTPDAADVPPVQIHSSMQPSPSAHSVVDDPVASPAEPDTATRHTEPAPPLPRRATASPRPPAFLRLVTGLESHRAASSSPVLHGRQRFSLITVRALPATTAHTAQRRRHHEQHPVHRFPPPHAPLLAGTALQRRGATPPNPDDEASIRGRGRPRISPAHSEHRFLGCRPRGPAENGAGTRPSTVSYRSRGVTHRLESATNSRQGTCAAAVPAVPRLGGRRRRSAFGRRGSPAPHTTVAEVLCAAIA